MPNRTTTLPGLWGAAGVETPVTPVAGQIYRKISATAEQLSGGWAYANVVPSDIFNQWTYLVSQLIKAAEQQGVMAWSALTDYNVGVALVAGSNGNIYVSNSPSGAGVPGVGAKDPVSDTAGTYWKFTGIGTGSVPGVDLNQGAAAPYRALYYGNIWG